MRFRPLRVVFLGALVVVACDSAPSAPSPAATFTITAAGVSPREVRIRRWGYVTFVNSDTRPHSIVSDPINEHSQCPSINQVAFLQPGQRRDSDVIDLTGTCRFHDHLNQADATLTGRIVVE